MKAEMSRDGRIIVVTVPITLRRRGGRTMIIAPEGMAVAPVSYNDDAVLKLVVRAHQWLRQLEKGRFGSIKELAEHEQHDSSYISKILSLTLLAPDIVEAILDRRQPDVLTWEELRKPFPMIWSEQRAKWGFPEPV
ncbi:MAG: hypothetical protein HQL91_10065 [Magnetococcales bacterium]|nr:hypothetical protein [Magnetococcales bacterium]